MVSSRTNALSGEAGHLENGTLTAGAGRDAIGVASCVVAPPRDVSGAPATRAPVVAPVVAPAMRAVVSAARVLAPSAARVVAPTTGAAPVVAAGFRGRT